MGRMRRTNLKGWLVGDSRLRSASNYDPQQILKRLSATQFCAQSGLCSCGGHPLSVSLSPEKLFRWRSTATRKLDTSSPSAWNFSRHLADHTSKTNPGTPTARTQPSSTYRRFGRHPGIRQKLTYARLCNPWKAKNKVINRILG